MIWSDDFGNYHCDDCGNRWKARSRYLWWPISFRWGDARSSCWFKTHGIEIGNDAFAERRVLARVFHFGRLKVLFGAKKKDPHNG